MYCPNCATQVTSEKVETCPKCGMPLEGLFERVAEYRSDKPEPEERSFSKQRLIGAAAFVALAAVPVGLGVKQSLQKEPRKEPAQS